MSGASERSGANRCMVSEGGTLASLPVVHSTDMVDARLRDYTLSDYNQYVVSSLEHDSPVRVFYS